MQRETITDTNTMYSLSMIYPFFNTESHSRCLVNKLAGSMVSCGRGFKAPKKVSRRANPVPKSAEELLVSDKRGVLKNFS